MTIRIRPHGGQSQNVTLRGSGGDVGEIKRMGDIAAMEARTLVVAILKVAMIRCRIWNGIFKDVNISNSRRSNENVSGYVDDNGGCTRK